MSNFSELLPAFIENPIAHRGFHDCQGLKSFGSGPENSRQSINQAITLGFGIEVDVRFSQDYVPIVIHDNNLMRLCGLNIDVSSTQFSDLLIAHLKNGETISSLEEVLFLVQGKVPLLLEIKSREKDQNIRMMTKTICDVIKDYNGPLALMSFAWGLITDLEIQKCNIPRGLISQFFCEDKELLVSDHERLGIKEADLINFGISFISHECTNLSKELYERNIKANRKVLTWTIYSKEMADKVKPMCDNITFEGFIPQKHKGEY